MYIFIVKHIKHIWETLVFPWSDFTQLLHSNLFHLLVLTALSYNHRSLFFFLFFSPFPLHWLPEPLIHTSSQHWDTDFTELCMMLSSEGVSSLNHHPMQNYRHARFGFVLSIWLWFLLCPAASYTTSQMLTGSHESKVRCNNCASHFLPFASLIYNWVWVGGTSMYWWQNAKELFSFLYTPLQIQVTQWSSDPMVTLI